MRNLRRRRARCAVRAAHAVAHVWRAPLPQAPPTPSLLRTPRTTTAAGRDLRRRRTASVATLRRVHNCFSVALDSEARASATQRGVQHTVQKSATCQGGVDERDGLKAAPWLCPEAGAAVKALLRRVRKAGVASGARSAGACAAWAASPRCCVACSCMLRRAASTHRNLCNCSLAALRLSSRCRLGGASSGSPRSSPLAPACCRAQQRSAACVAACGCECRRRRIVLRLRSAHRSVTL